MSMIKQSTKGRIKKATIRIKVWREKERKWIEYNISSSSVFLVMWNCLYGLFNRFWNWIAKK